MSPLPPHMPVLPGESAAGRRPARIICRARLPLGRDRHLELRLHVFFLFTLVSVTWVLARAFFPAVFPGWAVTHYWLVAVAVSLIDGFAGLVHELAHAGVALARGQNVHHITLYGLAAASHRSAEPGVPRDQVAIAVAGPVLQLLIATVLLFAATSLPI